MKDLGYGRGYQYAHDFEEQTAAMECLPEALAGRRFYEPKDVGLKRRSGAARRNAGGKSAQESPDTQPGRRRRATVDRRRPSVLADVHVDHLRLGDGDLLAGSRCESLRR